MLNNIKKQNYLIMSINSKTFIISYRYFLCFIKMKLNIKYKSFKTLFIYVTNIANLKIFFIMHKLLINLQSFFLILLKVINFINYCCAIW